MLSYWYFGMIDSGFDVRKAGRIEDRVVFHPGAVVREDPNGSAGCNDTRILILVFGRF